MDVLEQIAALGRFGTGLSQHARLITLASAQDSGLPESLMAEQFSGREAVNELYGFDVDALSVSTALDLTLFIGEELTITLLQPDGSRRAWHGICTEASWLGADGGAARYRLHLEPALALLRLRRDSYIFQDKSARDIISELLADYPQVRYEFDVSQELAARPVCTQYRESDLEFFTRLLASEGLSYRFEHDQPGDDSGDGQAKHRMVIFDSRARAPATPGNPTIRFHGVRATDSDDAIDQFRARRQVQANAVSISSWDPLQLVAPAAEQASALDAGELPAMSVYDGSGERIASASGAADPHSLLMLQALELDNKIFEGEGAVRRLAAGHGFALTQHERYAGDNAFTVLWVEHRARNNFQSAVAGLADIGVEAGTYRNRFACVRDTVAIVPRATAAPHAVTALGPQTAIVTGLADAVATTARDYHVKIQFAWQRGTGAIAGGMSHNLDPDGNAPGDETSGTWVRVAEALAGPNWGSQFTPRIGTEVLVDFIEGDMDRPIVVAQLYTGADTPPFSAGVESGVNHAGVLSGIHSHNFDGTGFNQWQLDDSTGQVRTRLATSTAATQLNLGYLVVQSPNSAQRGGYRGSGFELRTDAWAVVRGGEGVLLSTSTRSRRGSGIVSTQLDTLESVTLLKAAKKAAGMLADAASQQKALSSKGAAKALADFTDQIDPKAKGKYSGALNGQQALKATQGARALDGGQPVEKFGTPLVLMDAPGSINWATPASTLVFAGEQLHWSTQTDLHLAAGYTLSSVAGEAANLFSHSGGIQAFAGNGPVSLQAHTDELEILADKSISIISVNDSIAISARQKIVLQAGQSSITLDGANITFACPGNFTVKGGLHPFGAPSASPAILATLPDALIATIMAATAAGAPAAGSATTAGTPAPATPPGTPGTPAAPATPAPVTTGLGAAVDQQAAKSASLQADVTALKSDGWRIEYGPAGAGSHASRDTKVVVIDGALATDPNQATQVLAHEVGHARYPYVADFSSKATYVNGTLADEGAATLNNIKVRREILANGGPDIGIAGNTANHAAYNAAYDTFVSDGDAAKARQTIGGIFGSGEKTSTTNQPYSDYYGNWYDTAFPPPPPHP